MNTTLAAACDLKMPETGTNAAIGYEYVSTRRMFTHRQEAVCRQLLAPCGTGQQTLWSGTLPVCSA